jgi:hypothetical protein
LRSLLRCRLNRFLESRRLAGLNPASKTLAERADRTEFHRPRKLVTTTRAGVSVLRVHEPNRPSATIRAERNSMLHRVEGERLALLAVCWPVPQIIARFTHGSGSNPFRNKIPTEWCSAVSGVKYDFGDRGSSQLIASKGRNSRSQNSEVFLGWLKPDGEKSFVQGSGRSSSR